MDGQAGGEACAADALWLRSPSAALAEGARATYALELPRSPVAGAYRSGGDSDVRCVW